MSRERREIIYSIVIIVLIPALFVFNTVLITSRIRNDSNRTVRRNADQVNAVVAESLRKAIETKDFALANEQIKAINKQQPSVGGIFVVTKNGETYSIAARTDDAQTELTQNDKLQLSIVFERARSTAKRIDIQSSGGVTTKGWNVVSPLTRNETTVEAAISTNVLTSDAEELIDNTLSTSFIVTAVSVLVIILLLFHHFRFVGYADLLSRQKEVNQTMSDFLSVATHELRAPMSIIKGYISNVTDGTMGEINDKIKSSLNTAVAQTERLNNLVQDLLNVSRIEQGKITMDIQKINIQETIQTLVSNYSDRAKAKGLELVYDSQNAPAVMADAGRFQEIITNLIDNAFKYTPSGKVTISHRVENKMLVTSVVDTGPGMTADEQSRLFQRFYRVKNDNTKGIPGTGLGLWIVKQYAEKMGGRITVSSIVGVGTDFSVSLKLA